MSVTRVGTTKKFADNWENIFGGKKRSTTGKAAAKSSQKPPKKKLVAKLSGKQRSAKYKTRRKARWRFPLKAGEPQKLKQSAKQLFFFGLKEKAK